MARGAKRYLQPDAVRLLDARTRPREPRRVRRTLQAGASDSRPDCSADLLDGRDLDGADVVGVLRGVAAELSNCRAHAVVDFLGATADGQSAGIADLVDDASRRSIERRT